MQNDTICPSLMSKKKWFSLFFFFFFFFFFLHFSVFAVRSTFVVCIVPQDMHKNCTNGFPLVQENNIIIELFHG